MRAPVASRGIELSQKAFQRLLRIYPRAHRREYGPAMSQLFQDQCRDAWSTSRSWGLVKLWLLTLPDLFKTCLLEHLANLRNRKTMNPDPATAPSPRSRTFFVFASVGFCVFLVVLFAAVVVTFLLPESFASTARIKVDPDQSSAAILSQPQARSGSYDPYFIQTEMEILQSELVLDRVIDSLNLNRAWGKKFNAEGPLKTSESRMILKRMIEIRPVRNTSLVEVSVFSDNKEEAATIANTMAESYRAYRQNARSELISNNVRALTEQFKAQGKEIKASDPAVQQLLEHPGGPLVTIVDKAQPSLRPVRPNIRMNIFVGGLLAGFLALLIGGFAALLSRAFRRRTPAPGI